MYTLSKSDSIAIHLMGSFPAVWALWYWQLSYTSLVKPKSDIFTKWSSHTRILRVARSRWMNFFCDKYSWNRMNSARYFRVHRRRRRHHRHHHDDLHLHYLLSTVNNWTNILPTGLTSRAILGGLSHESKLYCKPLWYCQQNKYTELLNGKIFN